MFTKEQIQEKIKLLKENLDLMEKDRIQLNANIQAQRGGIQAFEMLLKDIDEKKKEDKSGK